MNSLKPSILSIAGSDSGSGAGIQADLKMSASLEVHCSTAITAITSQNTLGVQAIELVSAHALDSQIQSVLEDFDVHSIKIGMVGSTDNIKTIVNKLHQYQPKNIIIDPVLVSSSGRHLLERDALSAYVRDLLPLATLITPNIAEAATLLTTLEHQTANANTQSAMIGQAHRLRELLKIPAVLVTGGHLDSSIESEDKVIINNCVDALSYTPQLERAKQTKLQKQPSEFFTHRRIDSPHTHGTGCNLSTAIAAEMAKGTPLRQAIAQAVRHVERAIVNALDNQVGRGIGPLKPITS